MTVTITPIYGSLLTALFLVLSVRVALYRRDHKIAFGDNGGDRALYLLVRAQGNCSEYVPLGILMLLVAELHGAGALGLHIAGLCLLVGRVMHASYFSAYPDTLPLRAGGMLLTLTGIGLGAVLSLA